jgi:hypothetical protein
MVKQVVAARRSLRRRAAIARISRLAARISENAERCSRAVELGARGAPPKALPLRAVAPDHQRSSGQ